MDVAISGSTGLIGTALSRALEEQGHTVVPMVRGGEVRQGVRWDPAAGTIDESALEGVDAVVNLAGRPIRAGLWTRSLRREVYESRVRGTRTVAEALARLDTGPKVLVNASGINVYGERGDEELTEGSEPGTRGFLCEVCRAWEEATAPAADAGVRVVETRSGLVLSGRGGLLPQFLLPGGFVSGHLGSGRHWMSWISIDDEVRAILHLLQRDDLAGPFNLTGPNPVRNREFTEALARVRHRPRFLPVPAFALKLLFGRQAAEETALVSLRVLPERLLASGFEFGHRELEDAFRAVLAS